MVTPPPYPTCRAVIKKRICADVVFASHSQAWVELFRYIMGFYNRQRRHSTLGYISPYTFESQSEGLSFTPLNEKHDYRTISS